MSRKTGFSEFLKESYAVQNVLQDSEESDHWFEKRNRIFNDAKQQWTSMSQHDRNEYSQRAIESNKVANRIRADRLAAQKHMEGEQKLSIKERERHQAALVNMATNEKILFDPAANNGALPSLCNPQRVVQKAVQRGSYDIPIHDEGLPSAGQSFDRSATDVMSLLSSVTAKEKQSIQYVADSQSGCGFHGFGDDQFPISESMLETAMQSVPGFVQRSHQQFVADHSLVCDQSKHKINCQDQDADVLRNSCQEVCGRFCRCDILDERLSAYQNVVGMMRSIVRVMASKRSVKQGSNLYLSPTADCFFPVLLIHTPSTTLARVAYRISFKPMEVDWIRCGVREEDTTLFLSPMFAPLEDSNRIIPTTDTMNELCILVSKHCEASWKFEVFFQYDVTESAPTEFILSSHHIRHSADATTIGENVFDHMSSPVQCNKRKGDDMSGDLKQINQLIKKLDKTHSCSGGGGEAPTQRNSSSRSKSKSSAVQTEERVLADISPNIVELCHITCES